MALSIFEDKSKAPGNSELAGVLKENFKLWNELIDVVLKHYPAATKEWHYSGTNYGWGFRLRDSKRAIIYMTPCDGFFKASFVFGEKATKEALGSSLSEEILNIIRSAKVYAEGRGIRVDVKNKDLIEDIKKLIEIKLKY